MAEATPVPEAPGVLQGGWLTRVRVAGGASTPDGKSIFRWYQVYEFPAGSGQYVAYEYDSPAAMLQVFGGELPFFRDWSLNTFEKVVVSEAPAAEVIGQSGSWQILMRDIMYEAAAKAGIRDPGLAGMMAASPEMQRVMAQATVGDWTPEQIIAAQRNTNFWKNVLYPGIENLYDRTTNPEAVWREYARDAQPALEQLGYTRDGDGTYNTTVKRMLDKGIDMNTFLAYVPTFVQATQNTEYANILNQWAQSELGKTIGFNDWFQLLAGEAAPEIDAVAEKATLAWQAQNQGVAVSAAQISDLAARSQLTLDEAARAFADFNAGVLALGAQGLARAGLTRDEVLSVSAGVNPESGRSIEEVRALIAKTARENDLFDEEKINFYVGFTPQGTPMRPGLQSLTPEGA